MESFPVVCQRKTKNKTEVTHLGDVVYHRVKRWKVNFKLLIIINNFNNSH